MSNRLRAYHQQKKQNQQEESIVKDAQQDQDQKQPSLLRTPQHVRATPINRGSKTKDALGQHTRRLQVWLKHSITQITQPTATFDLVDHDSTVQETKELGLPPSSLSLSEMSAASTGLVGSSGSKLDCNSPYLVSNIDHALSALSFTAQRRVELQQTSQSYVPTNDWDWILDGHREWKEQADTTRQLVEEMYGYDNTNKDEGLAKIGGSLNGMHGNTALSDPWNFEEWKLSLGSIGNQEYQFADFQHQDDTNLEDNNVATNQSNDIDVGDEDDDDDEFGEFHEAHPVTSSPASTQQQNEQENTADSNDNPGTNNTEEDIGNCAAESDGDNNAELGNFVQASAVTTKITTPPSNISPVNISHKEMANYATGFITTDSIDVDDEIENPSHEGALNVEGQPRSPTMILTEEVSFSNQESVRISSPGERKNDDVGNHHASTSSSPPMLENLHSIDACVPDNGLATSINLTMTPTVNNRTCQPADDTPTSAKSGSTTGDYYDGDSDAFDPKASPPLDIMIPKTLDFHEDSDSDKKREKEEEFRNIQSEQLQTAAAAIPGATGSGDEDEYSFEATTSSWASSTIPSVVRFTSELTQTTAQGVAEAGSNLILRIPAAVRLSTPAKNSRQVIKHRDLIRAVEYSTNLTTNSLDGSARYLASPVTVGDEDHPSISSHEQLMKSPESKFRRRHSHPELELHSYAEDTGDTTDNLDKDEDEFSNFNEDDESLIQKLPKSYHYNPNYDDTAEVLLHTINWDWIPFWKLPRLVSPLPIGPEEVQRNIELAQDHITSRLGELDTLHLQVTRRLMHNIQPHQELLEEANGTVHLLAQNLSLSQIYAQRCIDSIRYAARGKDGGHGNDMWDGSTEGGLLSGVTLLDAWDQKRDYKEIRDLLESVHAALDLERVLNQRVASFDIRCKSKKCEPKDQNSHRPLKECQEILEMASKLKHRVHPPASADGLGINKLDAHEELKACGDSGLYRLECLEVMRERVRLVPTEFMKRLHWWLAAIAIQSCGCIVSSTRAAYSVANDYDTLVQALLRVNDYQRHQREAAAQRDSRVDTDDFAKSWSDSILSAFAFEANRAFCLALLDPTGYEDDGVANVAADKLSNEARCDQECDNVDEEWLLMLDEFRNQVLAHDNVWEDGEKLRTLAYSLVTLRFDWEISFSKHRGQGDFQCHLAPIYHRLCFLLTNVVNGYCSVLDWHERNVSVAVGSQNCDQRNQTESFQLQSVLTQLKNNRTLLWNSCLQVLEQCLDEYLKYVGKKPLFEWKQEQRLPQNQDSPGNQEALVWVQHDSSWWEDMEGLQDIARLTEQFCSLEQEFLSGSQGTEHGDSAQSAIATDSTQLRHKLHALMKKHLRTVHVEAMNGLGAMLSKEDWTLVPFLSGKTKSSRSYRSFEHFKPSGPYSGKRRIQQLLMQGLKLPTAKGRYRPVHRRSWQNRFCLFDSNENHLSRFKIYGNPFELEHGACSTEENQPIQDTFAELDSIMENIMAGEETSELAIAMNSVYDMILSYCGSNDPTVSNVIPRCVENGVFMWVSRLLLVMQRLPSVAEDAQKAFGNIFDLYATTVFRICVGSSAAERVVLGIDPPSKSSHVGAIQAANALRAQGTASPLFGFRRMSGRATPVKVSSASRTAPTISPNIEAELCAPLTCEFSELSPLRDFIMKAQENLHAIVKLDLADHWVTDPVPTASDTRRSFSKQVARVLEKRQAASWSCLFLAAGLHLSSRVATSLLSTSSEKDLNETKTLDEIQSYVHGFVTASIKFVSLSNRVSCMRAIRAKQIVQEIVTVGSAWEEAKLHEHPNMYVDSLCDLCSLIWCSLSAENRIPSGALKLLWEDLVDGGYVALLDGFSRVPFCSTEGRALMSMDLASFSSGVCPRSVLDRMEEHSHCSLPPPQKVGGEDGSLRGMGYVDTYIKVFYYPKLDVVGWIRDNFKRYQFTHSLALIAGTSSSTDDEGPCALELAKQVQALYMGGAIEQGLATSYYDI